jgi:membrane protease YdiL (CAAX protease family)
MWALEQPWTPRRSPVLADTPLALIASLGAGWFALASLTRAGWFAPAALGVVTLAATHGALLATALAWGEADTGVRLPVGTGVIPLALTAVGAVAAAVHELGAIAFMGTPAWLAVLALRGRLAGLGLGLGFSMRPVLVGGMIGALLGGHLLFSASQTLGYPLRGGGWASPLALWTYDVGANVVSAECFFRGALFNRLQRRWSFGPAAVVSTAFSLVRYLADPLLPGESEVMVGALFYVTILGGINCWLFSWSGSLAPGLLASALFFLAYRALAIG